MSHRELKERKRADYCYFTDFHTRWSDNDMYHHMNNSVYNNLYDSVVNSYLIKECGLHPPTSPQYGLVVYTHSNFFKSIKYPAIAQVAMKVIKLGRSSVTYEVAVFEKGADEVRSVGEMIHVFVDRITGRPAVNGINTSLYENLRKIMVEQPKPKL